MPAARVPTESECRNEDAGRTYRAIDAEQGVGQSRDPTYRPGSREDFDRLYCATYQRVFGTLLALLCDRAAAEDCTQEAYLHAFRAWPRWQPDAPAEAWLYRIAINVAISFRRRERLREVGQLIRRLGLPAQPDPTDAVMTSALLRELANLPPKQAAAVVLRYFHGFTNREIGQGLGVPERTVASRLMRARARLEERLGDAHEWRTPLTAGVSSDE